MSFLPGVYQAKKADNTIYYRSSITYRNKHISLGSFSTELTAHKAYEEASMLLSSSTSLEHYEKQASFLSFKKWVVLINFRDNHMYIKTPIYLFHRYFIYYLDSSYFLKFDVDDLFYYSTHSIIKRGGHLFVSDFGMQVNILSRYGIKNFAVMNKDYRFANGDNTDYRYANIEIINRYHGVSRIQNKGLPLFLAKIHINGDYIIGRYSSDVKAAIAYNKAANFLASSGCSKNFPYNYIDSISSEEYHSIYQKISISKNLIHWKR